MCVDSVFSGAGVSLQFAVPDPEAQKAVQMSAQSGATYTAAMERNSVAAVNSADPALLRNASVFSRLVRLHARLRTQCTCDSLVV